MNEIEQILPKKNAYRSILYSFCMFSGSKIVVIVGVEESPFGPSSHTYYETTSVNSDYNQIWRSSFFSLTLFGMKKINKYIYK